MESQEIRKQFLLFFKNKEHKVVSSASLVPADPTALFTSAGMQQFIPYLKGEIDSPYKRACSVQKCFRTSDIDEVGDDFHHTFFEMLGNWSFNDYFKEETINWSLEFLTEILNLDKDRLWVSVFKGTAEVPKDNEVINFWKKAGIVNKKIKELGIKDNFWGPVSLTGPCGPCSEIYYDKGKNYRTQECNIKNCGIDCDCGRFVEIWNLVFMQYNKTNSGIFEKLPGKNIDTGAGLERIASIIQNKKTNYETDLFKPIIDIINNLGNFELNKSTNKAVRIIADHLRGSCFLIADKVLPDKEDRGYILRKLIRKTMRHARSLNVNNNFLIDVANKIIDVYKESYPELLKNKNNILTIIQSEQEKFSKTLGQGLKKFKKLALKSKKLNQKTIASKDVFRLYDTYGFPFELTQEMAKDNDLKVSKKDFNKEFDKHKEISRAGASKKFGGVGQWGKKVAPLHTATHLLHQALRQVLGDHVQQAGSDLTPDRLRFDFIHPAKLTNKEIFKIENIVNQKIKEQIDVKVKNMSYNDAIIFGALAFFKEKYPKQVSVYIIGDYSKEVCAGPHVKNTKEIGMFKIKKQESSGAGIRRIKAIVQN